MYGVDDPRSIFYERKIIKPKITYCDILWNAIVILDFVFMTILFFFPSGLLGVITILCMKVFFLINFRRLMIFSIKIYQICAPSTIRNRCRFEPSCSNYFIECLEKYGSVKGLVKGIDRLVRCSMHDGGFDKP